MPRSRTTPTPGGERATGRQLHERVTALIAANPGMTQAAAFQALAERGEADGRTPANIAATYYRIQRQMGNGRSTTRARAGTGERTRTRSQLTDTERMLDRIERDVKDVLQTLAAARAGLSDARAAQERVEAVRRAIA